MIKIFSLVIVTITLVGFIIVITGYQANPKYQGSRDVIVDSLPGDVWKELVNVKDTVLKKKDVGSVEIISQYGNLTAWKENLKNGGYRTYRMTEYITNERLVIELVESSYGLTGIWEMDFSFKDNLTFVRITENSTLDNVYKRGWRAYFGRNHDLLIWAKYIDVGNLQDLIKRS